MNFGRNSKLASQNLVRKWRRSHRIRSIIIVLATPEKRSVHDLLSDRLRRRKISRLVSKSCGGRECDLTAPRYVEHFHGHTARYN